MGRMSDIDNDFFEQESESTSSEVQTEVKEDKEDFGKRLPIQKSSKLELPSLGSSATLINLQITTWTAYKASCCPSVSGFNQKIMAVQLITGKRNKKITTAAIATVNLDAGYGCTGHAWIEQGAITG